MSVARCPRYRFLFGHTSTNAVALSHAARRAFWRAHPRSRVLPDTEVEAGGQLAIVARFQSLTESAEFVAVVSRETLELLAVHSAPES